MRSSMPTILLAIWRHPARTNWSMIACATALSFAVLTLAPRIAVDADGAVPDPTRFDPVSSLAVEEWSEPAEAVVPTNSHPYPEALAAGGAAGSRVSSDPFSRTPSAGVQPRSGITLMPGAVLSGLMLSAEQLHVARFYAEKYRLPLEQVAEAVANAYFTAREMRVDPLLVVAVISIESAFNPKARSGQGAEGLMQVRTIVHEEKFQAFGGVASAFDPVANIQVGVRILRDHLLREGSVEGALKAYVGAAKRRYDGGYGLRVMRERESIQQVLAAHLEAESVSLVPSLRSPEQFF